MVRSLQYGTFVTFHYCSNGGRPQGLLDFIPITHLYVREPCWLALIFNHGYMYGCLSIDISTRNLLAKPGIRSRWLNQEIYFP